MNKNKLIKVFDDNAVLYDKYRPTYPSEVTEDLIELSRLHKEDRIVEIGCGTGQLTLDLIRKDYEVVAVEKGEALANIARSKLAKYGRGQVINTTFENWDSAEKFQLMVSAQAFHWIDKEEGINKTIKLLKKEGSIGLIWNVDESRETEFWKQTSKVYEKYLPIKKGQGGVEQTIDEHWQYLHTKKELRYFERREYEWKKLYTKEAYLGLLSTFSPHMSMEAEKRRKFFHEIEKIIAEFDDQVVRHYRTVLLFSSKRGLRFPRDH